MALTTKFYSANPVINQSFTSSTVFILETSSGYAGKSSYSQGTFSSSYHSIIYTVPSGRTAKINLAPLMSIGWSPYISVNNYYLLSVSWGNGGNASWYAGGQASMWHQGDVTFYINGARIYLNSFFASHSGGYTYSYVSSGARYSVWGGQLLAQVSSSATSSILSSEMIHYLGPGQSIDMRWQYNGYAFHSTTAYYQGGGGWFSIQFSASQLIDWQERGAPMKFNFITIEEAGS